MSRFAVARVAPRSIAWLANCGDWKRLERIIMYNCAVLGGCFNVIIPVSELRAIEERYRNFLREYDPDIVVLPPGMDEGHFAMLDLHLHPFAVVPWASASQVISSDAWAASSEWNAPVPHIHESGGEAQDRPIIAVADPNHPDGSNLALVACGNVQPRELMPIVMDGVLEDTTASGYREYFLWQGVDQEAVAFADLCARLGDEHQVIAAPDRFSLAGVVLDDCAFPLINAVNILEKCCSLQQSHNCRRTFVGRTTDYKAAGGSLVNDWARVDAPAFVILVSDEFDFEKAALFWNLRASQVTVAWLSFSQLRVERDGVASWLRSDFGGVYHSLGRSGGIAFAATARDLPRLSPLVESLNETLPAFSKYGTHLVDELVKYHTQRPALSAASVSVTEDGDTCTFVPILPWRDRTGVLTVTLQWDGLMVPPNDRVRDLVSPDTVNLQYIFAISKEPVSIPRFRPTRLRFVSLQIHSESPVEFTRPSAHQVVNAAVESAGFLRVQPSSAARYHANFVNLAGDLKEAAHYLCTSPYRTTMGLLADNRTSQVSGWILQNPSKRRALHHLHLRAVMGYPTPEETESYFAGVADELPPEAAELLEKGILERGFLLRCQSCSFRSWYPVEAVGRNFCCTRCAETQPYKTNPLWLYKLREVVFQGFEDNMQVPLLALDALRRKSKHHFQWVPDSDVYWESKGAELHRNVDLLCLIDGKMFMGEAKSNDTIDEDQFSFYRDLGEKVALDGLVFATSQPEWSTGTQSRIDQLQGQFSGEVVVMTEADLYPALAGRN